MARGFRVKVTGSRGIVANLHARRARIAEDLRAEVRETAEDWRALARQYAPVDEGNLRDSIAYELSPGGLVWQGFHDAAHYPDENYGDMQEVGFRHHLSGEFIQNPHLLPAFQETAETAGTRLGNVVRRHTR